MLKQKTLALLLFILLFALSPNEIHSQALSFAAGNEFIVSIPKDSLVNVGDISIANHNIFMIFPDGHFEHKSFYSSTSDYSFQGHEFHPNFLNDFDNNLSFKAIVNTRYEIPDPPESVIIEDELEDPNTISLLPSSSTLQTTIESGSFIKIDTNHHVIPGKDNVFAITYNSTLSDGEIFFFLDTLSFPTWQTISPVHTTGNFEEIAFDATDTEFNMVLKYKPTTQPDYLSENRIFFQIQNNSEIFDPGETKKFMAALASTNPSAVNLDDFPKLGKAHKNIFESGQVINDFEQVSLNTLLPGDPSKLTLKCKKLCNKNSCESHLMKFNYSFCNEGKGSSDTAWLSIDNSNGFIRSLNAQLKYSPGQNHRQASRILQTASGNKYNFIVTPLTLLSFQATQKPELSCAIVEFEVMTKTLGSKAIKEDWFTISGCSALLGQGGADEDCDTLRISSIPQYWDYRERAFYGKKSSGYILAPNTNPAIEVICDDTCPKCIPQVKKPKKVKCPSFWKNLSAWYLCTFKYNKYKKKYKL